MTADEQSPTNPPSPELRPPGAPSQADAGNTGQHGLLWGALITVVLLGLAVVLVLPKIVSAPGQVESAADQPVHPAAPETSSTRDDAAQALQDFLHTRARLELANAPVWGDPEWSQAIEGASRGNDLFAQSQFSNATEVLTDSNQLLVQLEGEKGQRLESALNTAWQALQNDESETASGFFELALAIETDNESAIAGAEQARFRPEVLRLMTAGASALSMGELNDAQALYFDAVELDGVYKPAELALQDVTGQIIDLTFRDAMSRALSAIEAEQLQTAETALQQAASLKPDEDVIRNTRYELAQLRQKLWLESQRQQAVKDVQNENWSAAVAVYRKVLAKVPQAAFAQQGLTFAQDRERLHRQIDHYLTDPTRVYSDQPRANAEQLLESAGQPPALEVHLTEKISRLQTLIAEAQRPLIITLQSDGLTLVQIYHVGKLGQFTSQQLELRPGTYTVVGSRPGYRDVRQTFTLKPGTARPVVDIRCEEPV